MDQNSQKTKKIREKENAILDPVSPKFNRLQKRKMKNWVRIVKF